MSSEPSIQNVLSFSWDKAKEILFPFEAKRWLKILFIVWLAGHAAGLGGNFNIPRKPPPASQEVQREKTPSQQEQIPDRTQTREQLDDTQGIPQAGPANLEKVGKEFSALSPLAIVLVSGAAILLMLLFLWFSARFNFIFLELLVERDVKIRDSFRKYQFLGNSYFLLSLAFMAIGIGGILTIALLIAIAAGVAKPILWLLIPLLIIFAIALGIFGTLVNDFALPMMYQDGIKTMDALKKWGFLKANLKQVAVYLLIKLGLGIVSGILVMVIGFVVLLAALILGFAIAFLGGLIGTILAFLKPILIVIGILLLVCAVVASIVIIGLITLPVPIFFRSFALAYLARLNPNYNLLNFPLSGPNGDPAG